MKLKMAAIKYLLKLVFIFNKGHGYAAFTTSSPTMDRINKTQKSNRLRSIVIRCTIICALAILVSTPIFSLSAEPNTSRIADRILSALQAANAVRGENSREAQRWKEERQRLQVLEATLRQRIEQQRLQQKKLEAQIDTLRKQNKEIEPQRLLISKLKDLAMSNANKIHTTLDQKAQTLVPGVIQKRNDEEQEALNQIQSALNRLEATENNMKNVAIELATGRYEGKPLAVELLRMGGALAWWRSFDGKRAGHAVVKNGLLELSATENDSERRAINQACNIAKGRAAPEIVLLPILPPLNQSEATEVQQ